MTDRTQNGNFSFMTLIRTLRINQWTKNAVVFAAFLFAFWDKTGTIYKDMGALKIAFPAALLFCLTSSGIYILNDIRDIKADQRHPRKKYRPIASGLIPIPTAWVMCIILLTTSITGSFAISFPFAGVIACYIILQLLYSLGLKNIALFDIFIIATGFVLRAIAGAVALDVLISPWLLLCTFLLALFLALCKRRYEKVALSDLNGEQRESLEKYDKHLLDQLIAIISATTIVSYAMYTLAPDTVSKFGTSALGFTVPFVAFGIFRYLDLVYRHEKGDRPERILLTDIPTIINLIVYVTVVVLTFIFK
jgi:4-hydroxybenzoate polyprenyltransferase